MNQQGGGGSGTGLQWSAWSAGEATDGDGSLFVGLDAKNDSVLAGIAFAETDDSFAVHDDKLAGNVGTNVRAVYPYVRWKVDQRFEGGLVWAREGWPANGAITMCPVPSRSTVPLTSGLEWSASPESCGQTKD